MSPSTIKEALIGLLGAGVGRVATLVRNALRAIFSIGDKRLMRECTAQEQGELCEPQVKTINEDGSILERCKACEREWLWVLKGNEPYKVFECEREGGEWVEVMSFENKDEY